MNTNEFVSKQMGRYINQEEARLAAQPHPLDNWLSKEYPDAKEVFLAPGHGYYPTREAASKHVPDDKIIRFREVIE